MTSAEQEQVVRAALLPDPGRAIDATLEHLYPLEEQDGFTCILHLSDLDEPPYTIVRKVLSAGAAINLVRPDGAEPQSYQVHAEFYKLLARLRAVPSLAVLTNGLRDAPEPAKTFAPTEHDINRALSDVAMGLSDFAILARNGDGDADYIQIGAGGAPFRVECRVWLNQFFAEHFHITEPGCSEGFADINDVAEVMFYWLRTARLPQYVTIRNITKELRQLEREPHTQPPTGDTHFL